jgi:hypothetical protein
MMLDGRRLQDATGFRSMQVRDQDATSFRSTPKKTRRRVRCGLDRMA